MIVALDEAKRRLVALEDVLAELKNQLRNLMKYKKNVMHLLLS